MAPKIFAKLARRFRRKQKESPTSSGSSSPDSKISTATASTRSLNALTDAFTLTPATSTTTTPPALEDKPHYPWDGLLMDTDTEVTRAERAEHVAFYPKRYKMWRDFLLEGVADTDWMSAPVFDPNDEFGDDLYALTTLKYSIVNPAVKFDDDDSEEREGAKLANIWTTPLKSSACKKGASEWGHRSDEDPWNSTAAKRSADI